MINFGVGQGSDLAGVAVELGSDNSEWGIGYEVLGFTDDRASQAEYVAVDANHLAHKPAGLSWERASALHVVGATAWAVIGALDLRPADTVVVSGAAGGVGSLSANADPEHRAPSFS